MNPGEKPVALPLDYTAEIAFELHLMRGECGGLAQDLVRQRQLDEAALEECAQLDDALAKAQAILQVAVKSIKALQARRQNPA